MEETACVFARMKTLEVSKPAHFIIDAYPNPFGNNITIDIMAPLDGDADVSITDVTGRVVESFTHASGKINTGGNLKPGVYFVNVTHEDYHQVIKIVKTGYDK